MDRALILCGQVFYQLFHLVSNVLANQSGEPELSSS